MPGTLFWKAAFSCLITIVFPVSAGNTVDNTDDLPRRQMPGNFTRACSLDQSMPPGNLTVCDNSTLFQVWRPKARFIAPEGWMNDPQGKYLIIFQFTDRFGATIASQVFFNERMVLFTLDINVTHNISRSAPSSFCP